MPVNIGVNPRFSSGYNKAMPPTWAIASVNSTPGITGFPGKWPWKNNSLNVAFLMPTARFIGSNSIIRSTNSIG